MKHLTTFHLFEQLVQKGWKQDLLDDVVDFFMPGTPVENGRNLLKQFDAIIKRRIDFNKKNNLPLGTLTDEEKKFRERILKAIPNFGYPDLFDLAKIIQDINSGKNIQSQELKKYKGKDFAHDYGMSGGDKHSDQELQSLMGSREELKKMWLGIDEPGGENKGYYIKSEFKPDTSTKSNAVYFRPKDIPTLTTQQFDELYTQIMKTRKTNGKFPGGNGKILFDNEKELKSIDKKTRDKLIGDMGHFKFGAGEEGGKKWISLYDEWDLVPPSAQKFGVDIQKYGNVPLIYYRIYRK